MEEFSEKQASSRALVIGLRKNGRKQVRDTLAYIPTDSADRVIVVDTFKSVADYVMVIIENLIFSII